MGMSRLIAVAIACLVAAAHASPPSPSSTPRAPITPPPGWKAAPKLARAAASAAGTEAAKVVASEAWSEPSIGCYAMWLRMWGPAAPTDRAAQQLVAGLEKAGFTVRDVVAPMPPDRRGVVGLRLSKAPYHGLLRAVVTSAGELDAVACAWNQREPSICAPACAKLMEAVQ